MDRMLVVVFDSESKAYEGKKALQQLDEEGSIHTYAYAVVAKKPDGTGAILQGDDVGPVGSLVGTSIGSLIGLLGGPVGLVAGSTLGLTYGAMFDLHDARIAGDYLDDVIEAMTTGKVAVIAEVDEAWTTPVDARMESLGGTVFRRSLAEVTDAENQKELDAMKADLDQYKAELGKERADRKAKIQDKITRLEAKIQAHREKIQNQLQAAERLAKAKAEHLRGKAAPTT